MYLDEGWLRERVERYMNKGRKVVKGVRKGGVVVVVVVVNKGGSGSGGGY